MAIKQRPEETLKEYMLRFNNESLQVKDRDDKVVMAAFINGLRLQKLYEEFVEKPPRTVREMLDRAHDRANADEARRLKSEQEKPRDDRKRKGVEMGGPREGPRQSIFERLSRGPSSGQTRAPLPLTASQTQILAVMEQQRLVRSPPKLSGTNRDPNRYCAFHRDIGHDTEKCRELKKEIQVSRPIFSNGREGREKDFGF